MMNTWMRPWRTSDGHQSSATSRAPAERTFRGGDVPSVRRFAGEFGTRAGIGAGQLADFRLAVHEAAACAVAAGSCAAKLRLWTAGARAFCVVSGGSTTHQRPGSGWPGDVEAVRRRLLHQLCDYVSVQSGPDGVTVLLSMTVT